MSVPNQKIIQNFNYEPCDNEHYYAKINLKALEYVSQDNLTPNAFRLWIYLSKNRPDFTRLELSRQECMNWGVGRTQYAQAFSLLESKGYLVKRNEGSNIYDFYQLPQNLQGGSETVLSLRSETVPSGNFAIGSETVLCNEKGSETDLKMLEGSETVPYDKKAEGVGNRPQEGTETDLKGTDSGRERLYNTTINITDTDSLSPNGDKESYTAATISFDEFKRMKEEGSYQVDMEDQWFLYVSLKDSKNRFRFMKKF